MASPDGQTTKALADAQISEDVKPMCPLSRSNDDDRRAESPLKRPLSLCQRNAASQTEPVWAPEVAGSMVRESDLSRGPAALAVDGGPPRAAESSDSRIDVRLVTRRSGSALPPGNPFRSTGELEELFNLLEAENHAGPVLEWTRRGPNLLESKLLPNLSESERYLECSSDFPTVTAGEDPFHRTLVNLNLSGVASLCSNEEDLFRPPFASALEPNTCTVSCHPPDTIREPSWTALNDPHRHHRPALTGGFKDALRFPEVAADRRLLLDEELDQRLRSYLDVRWRQRLQAQSCGRRDRLQLLRATDSESWCLDRSSRTVSRTKNCRGLQLRDATRSEECFSVALQPVHICSEDLPREDDLPPNASETAVRRSRGRCALRLEDSRPPEESSPSHQEPELEANRDSDHPEVDVQIRPEPPKFSRDDVEDEAFYDDDSGSSECSLTDTESDGEAECVAGPSSPGPSAPCAPLSLEGPVLVRCIDERTLQLKEMLLCSDDEYRRAASQLPRDAPRCRVLQLLLQRSKPHQGELFHVLMDAGRSTPLPTPEDREVRLADVCSALAEVVEAVADEGPPLPEPSPLERPAGEGTPPQRSLSSLKRVNVDEILSSVFVASFRRYSKLGGRLKSGAVLTRANSGRWLQRAGLVDDRFGPRAAADDFAAFARSKLVLNMADYVQFLIRVARRKRMIVMDLVQQLVTAKAPTTTAATAIRHKPNTAKRCTATSARSDPWRPRSRRRTRSLTNIKLGQTAPPAAALS